MDFHAFIKAKQSGKAFPPAALTSFIQGVVNQEITDPQLSSFVTTAYLLGLNTEEISHLTRAMANKGETFNWSLPGPVVDKHSTGGVGDLVSLILGPILAACGLYVPMISGRRLGHTGGTIDKLESIKGYNSAPDLALFRHCVSAVGVAIVGQSGNMAPADKRMYAIRHQTATVDSIPLITASILAKKLAEGLDGLILDIKFGSGAFMLDESQARLLANSLRSVAAESGLACDCVLSDMNSPLAHNIGNGLEVLEAIDFLTAHRRHQDLCEVTCFLAAKALLIVDQATTYTDAIEQVNRVLDSGKAAEKFAQMVACLGGPADIIERPLKSIKQAKIVRPLLAERDGYVHRVNCKGLGNLTNNLATSPNGKIDHSTGISDFPSIGTHCVEGESICFIHANSEQSWDLAAKQVQSAISIKDQKIKATSRLTGEIIASEKEKRLYA